MIKRKRPEVLKKWRPSTLKRQLDYTCVQLRPQMLCTSVRDVLHQTIWIRKTYSRSYLLVAAQMGTAEGNFAFCLIAFTVAGSIHPAAVAGIKPNFVNSLGISRTPALDWGQLTTSGI